MAARPESLSGKDKGSFAFLTIKDRLPDILTKVIDAISRLASTYHSGNEKEKAEDAKEIVSKLARLKNEMQTDKAITVLRDDYHDVDLWNTFINELPILVDDKTQPSWYSVAWLSCECYLYRRIFEALRISNHHKLFDPFFQQKLKSFSSSEKPMQTLASYVMKFFDGNSADNETSDQIRLDFEMLLEYCLWGNKCDLSISSGTQVSNQLKESSQLKALLEHIISNHTSEIWTYISNLRSGADKPKKRFDFVLDNAGFELFTDLCLAEFLLDKGFCDVVYFHVKNIPWFVSDTSKFDLEWTVQECVNSTDAAVHQLGNRWKSRLDNQTFVITQNSYWTLPYDFAAMKKINPELYSFLSSSNLVIFKGDLNYRKLIGDRKWPHTTGFSDALYGFCPAPLCSLRTLKADLVVGLKPCQDDELAKKNKNWMVSGEYAVIQFCRKL